MDVLNLMRVNQNKIKEEANLKVECLIQFYEEKCA